MDLGNNEMRPSFAMNMDNSYIGGKQDYIERPSMNVSQIEGEALSKSLLDIS